MRNLLSFLFLQLTTNVGWPFSWNTTVEAIPDATKKSARRRSVTSSKPAYMYTRDGSIRGGERVREREVQIT